MKRIAIAILIGSSLLLSTALTPLSSQTSPPQPLTLPLECAERDCLLLGGAPQTAGMRSGFVRLSPGESVGWHTTGQNEEALVVIRGQGEAHIEGQSGIVFTAPKLVYIPPVTRHNVTNTGHDVLVYVYVVAPAKSVAASQLLRPPQAAEKF